jgi:hypothetical protein
MYKHGSGESDKAMSQGFALTKALAAKATVITAKRALDRSGRWETAHPLNNQRL